MKKRIIKLLCLILAMLLLVPSIISCSEADVDRDDDDDRKKTETKDRSDSKLKNTEITVGLSAPLTGPAAIYGMAVKNAAEMAVSEINDAGGINGIKLKLISQDDGNDHSKVGTNFATLVEQGMQISLGCATTMPCLEFAHYAKENDMFLLTPTATSDNIANGTYAYQMSVNDSAQGKLAAEYVNSLGVSEIGIFYKADDPYSTGIYERFRNELDSNISVVEASFVAETDYFETQIETLKNCKLIFMPIYYSPANAFIRQAAHKMSSDTCFFGCDGFDGIDAAFDLSDIPQKISMLSPFDTNATEGKAGAFVKKYTSMYGNDAIGFAANAYDSVWAIYYALTAAANEGVKFSAKTSPSDFCDILTAQFKKLTFSGATGNNITWNNDGTVSKAPIVKIIKNANG